jgi:Tfp pilus assembly protein PilF
VPIHAVRKIRSVCSTAVCHLLEAMHWSDPAHRVALLVLALSLSAAVFSVADEIKNKSRAQAQFEQCVALAGEQKYGEAETCFKKTVEIDPKFAGAYLGLSDLRLKQGDIAGAGTLIQKAMAVAPTSAGVQTAWGQYLFSQKRFEEAEKAYQTAVRLDPKAAAPLIQLGDLDLLGRKDPQNAVVNYQAALALNSSDFHANFMLATALLALGKRDAAEIQLVKAKELAPRNLAVRKTLAELQVSREEFDAAAENYRKILEIAPNMGWARVGLGDVCMRRKDYNCAIVAFRDALRADPKAVEAQTKLAMSQQLKGDAQSAEAGYRRALEMDSKNGVAANNLAWLLCSKDQRPQEALPWALKAVASDPKNGNFLDTQGWVMRANGDVTGALVALKKANMLAPNKPEILYHLGVAYQESGKASLAEECYKKALAIDTTFSGAEDAQARLAALQAHT